MRKYLFVLLMLVSLGSLAAPKITGTQSELQSYLQDSLQTVTLSASASTVALASQAKVKLLVETESPTLSKALKENSDVRDKIRIQIERKGVDPKNIRDSKFSTTPDYGSLGSRPKSYRVENIMTIIVTSEDQLIQVASVTDRNQDVHHLSTTAELGDTKKLFNKLLRRALTDVIKKAEIYKKEFGVKMVPVSFFDSIQNTQEMLSKGPASATGQDDVNVSVSNYSESKLTTSVAVTYKVSRKTR